MKRNEIPLPVFFFYLKSPIINISSLQKEKQAMLFHPLPMSKYNVKVYLSS
jgi:hypothetical protein